jgi:hypothetical protein
MRVLSIAMVLLLGLLVVHAAAYGAGFLADPDEGLSEFGYEVADTVGDDGTTPPGPSSASQGSPC